MLLEIRETYLNTVSVLIEAAESQNPTMVGHSERTAAVARSIGAQYGLSTNEIERLSYGALLHDIGKIADAPADELAAGSSAAIVSDAAFFEHVVPILEVLDDRAADAGGHPREGDLIAGFIVALSSDIDQFAKETTSGDAMATRLSPRVPSKAKADVVAAALALGYSVPAID